MNSCDDVIDVSVSHTAVNGKGNFTLVFMVSNWVIFRLVSIGFTIVGMDMQRDKVNARSDITLFQFLDKTGAVNAEMFEIESQHVKMPGMSRLCKAF